MVACQADFMKLDLSSLKQVKEFAMNFKAKRLPLQLEGRKASLGQPSWVLLEDLPAPAASKNCDDKLKHGAWNGKAAMSPLNHAAQN